MSPALLSKLAEHGIDGHRPEIENRSPVTLYEFRPRRGSGEPGLAMGDDLALAMRSSRWRGSDIPGKGVMDSRSQRPQGPIVLRDAGCPAYAPPSTLSMAMGKDILATGGQDSGRAPPPDRRRDRNREERASTDDLSILSARRPTRSGSSRRSEDARAVPYDRDPALYHPVVTQPRTRPRC